ncbi:hypothetical protein BDK51DRAFT_31037 [Blyttiomyces helicus]|uniref:Protein kinase domain-containing protein n=1 Tax=Blyttiomyces helicus TaxID=388810 RepID=A0A4P9WHB6_9FUNG|nr:hypothetical protein BDK51DRAFT_31037 [Blyttiomyces helicus]|eukprot:RKO91335.1 hypothetical protein BDK51DRAFT_31037 [Blyttiomyces helicus]
MDACPPRAPDRVDSMQLSPPELRAPGLDTTSSVPISSTDFRLSSSSHGRSGIKPPSPIRGLAGIETEGRKVAGGGWLAKMMGGHRRVERSGGDAMMGVGRVGGGGEVPVVGRARFAGPTAGGAIRPGSAAVARNPDLPARLVGPRLAQGSSASSSASSSVGGARGTSARGKAAATPGSAMHALSCPAPVHSKGARMSMTGGAAGEQTGVEPKKRRNLLSFKKPKAPAAIDRDSINDVATALGLPVGSAAQSESETSTSSRRSPPSKPFSPAAEGSVGPPSTRGVAPPPKPPLPPHLALKQQEKQAAAAQKSSKPAPAAQTEKEDDERNRRHNEVVSLMSGKKKLSPRFSNRYKIGDLLGDGAFGFVLTAKRLVNGSEVAVKFIIKDKIPRDLWVPSSPISPHPVPLEVHILSQLSHPNIISYVEHIDEPDYVLLITELHGTEWDALANKALDVAKNPGLREKPRGEDAEVGEGAMEGEKVPAGKSECSPLFRLTKEQEKSIRRRTSCDLFECIDSRIPEETSKRIFAQIAMGIHYLDSQGIVHRDLKDEVMIASQ